MNLVGTRSTASLTPGKYGDAVERVPTIPRRFMGRGAQGFLPSSIGKWHESQQTRVQGAGEPGRSVGLERSRNRMNRQAVATEPFLFHRAVRYVDARLTPPDPEELTWAVPATTTAPTPTEITGFP